MAGKCERTFSARRSVLFCSVQTIVHCEYCGSHDGDNTDRSLSNWNTSEIRSRDAVGVRDASERLFFFFYSLFSWLTNFRSHACRETGGAAWSNRKKYFYEQSSWSAKTAFSEAEWLPRNNCQSQNYRLKFKSTVFTFCIK